jgi:hypothetical protein
LIVHTPPQKPSPSCLTCYGTGEVASENGPETCPDCFGAAAKLSQHTRNEWRLSALEQAYRSTGREASADVMWLVHEVRRSQDALVRILARCQDAPEADAVAQYVRFEANQALGFYEGVHEVTRDGAHEAVGNRTDGAAPNR